MNLTLNIKDVLTLSDAAKFLRLPRSKVRDAAEAGEIPGLKVRGVWLIIKSVLLEWFRGGPMPSVDSFLRQAGLFNDDEALTALVEAVYRDRGRPLAKRWGRVDAAH
jgi:excisionase family DNA binding protein